MASIKGKRVLFFIRGNAPSNAQRSEAAAMNGDVAFRNVLFIRDDETIEPFDELAGDPPASYLAAAAAKAGLPPPVEAPPVDGASDTAPALAGLAGASVAPRAVASGGWKPNA